jgi:putative thioredoxin
METLIGGGAPDGAAAADLVKDSDTAHFQADVIDASREVPVIVDFWATWCGPCKQLGPMIEKLVTEAGGKVKLVKIDVDQNQALAQQLRIQSIPAVYAFKDGQPVDGFVGALPESQLRAFIESLTEGAGGGAEAGENPVAQALDQARAMMEAGDTASAGQLYARIIEHEPGNVAAAAGLARCAVAAGDVEQAKQALAALPPEAANDPDVGAARAAIELAEASAGAGDVAGLQAAVDADPADLQARLDLANALYAGGQAEAALDHLLEIVRRDKEWNEEAGRKQIVKIFEALGPSHPLTLAGRRRLSSLLFS